MTVKRAQWVVGMVILALGVGFLWFTYQAKVSYWEARDAAVVAEAAEPVAFGPALPVTEMPEAQVEVDRMWAERLAEFQAKADAEAAKQQAALDALVAKGKAREVEMARQAAEFYAEQAEKQKARDAQAAYDKMQTEAGSDPAIMEEDEPGFDCRVDGNGACGDSIDTNECGPVGDPRGCPKWSGASVEAAKAAQPSCDSLGMLTAEDGSCVSESYYEEPPTRQECEDVAAEGEWQEGPEFEARVAECMAA